MEEATQPAKTQQVHQNLENDCPDRFVTECFWRIFMLLGGANHHHGSPSVVSRSLGPDSCV